MAIAAGVRNLDFKQLFVLAKVFLANPRYIIPTLNATKETIQISNSNFGKEHHSNNRTNAFRHALWNFLICHQCYRVIKSKEKALEWSRKITDMHEKFAPNEELEKMMDLHNNKVGRILFGESHIDRSDIVFALKEKMISAVKVKYLKDISSAGKELVFTDD